MTKDKRNKAHASSEIKWAWERNGAKRNLTGCASGIDMISVLISLTAEEVLTLEKVVRDLNRLLSRWDGNNIISKANYLRRISNDNSR